MPSARLGRWLRDLGLPVPAAGYTVYHPDYADLPRADAGSAQYDRRRGGRILEHLQRARVLARAQQLRPASIDRRDLLRVHPARFLEEIATPSRLAALLDLPAQSVALHEDPLEPFRLQAGGTLLAAAHALEHRVPVFNLGGGFHHAARTRAAGFCPLNDVAVAIEALRARGALQRVLVVDLDAHPGDGTAEIYAGDDDVFTLSVHGHPWRERLDERHDLDIALGTRPGDRAYLETIRRALHHALSHFHPELAFYLAGADPWEHDRLGDLGISRDALLERDLFVHRTLEAAGVPYAALLAGGYGPQAWCIPYNFVFSVLVGAPIDARHSPDNIAAQYERVHHDLSRAELTTEHGGDLTDLDEDVIAELTRHRPARGSSRLLGFYTRDGLELALERYGFFDLLRDRGFEAVLLSIDTTDPARQLVRIHDTRRDRDHLLIELALRRRQLTLPGQREPVRLLSIEWLLLQDPRARFSATRPPLPGQIHPGLGLFRWVAELLRLMAVRLECDGLVNVPDHYHNAHLYGKVMRFVDPNQEGLLRALERDLADLPLHEATRAIDEGRVRQVGRGEVVRWEGTDQVGALTPRTLRYFRHDGYRAAVQRVRDALRFEVDD